jgi:hypothetical protein
VTKGKVEITTGTKNEFDLTASVLLLTDDGEDWIDSIFDAEGDDAVQQCIDWVKENNYEIHSHAGSVLASGEDTTQSDPLRSLEPIVNNTAETLLLELIRSVSTLSIGGTLLRVCDTRLNRAIIEAEKYFEAKSIITDAPRPRRPVSFSRIGCSKES